MYVPVIPVSGIGGLRFLEETEEAQLEALKADPEVAREVEYFKENIASATSSDALLADRRLLEVALTAYGLESEIDKTAFIKRVLDEGTENDQSIANRLNDRRWTEFAKAFGYGDTNTGGRVTAFQASIELRFRGDGAPDKYENAISDADLASFRANIDSIGSIDALLADPTTLNVALEAYGLERGFYTDDHFRTLLTEGPNGSYASGLDPAAWKSFASAFSGLGDGETPEIFSKFEMFVAREFERRGASPLANPTDAESDPNRVSTFDFDAFAVTVSAATDAATILADDNALEVTLAAFNLNDDGVSNEDARAILNAAAGGDFTLANAQFSADWTRAAEAIAEAFENGVHNAVTGARYNIELNIASDDLEALDYLRPVVDPLPTVDTAELEHFRSVVEDIEDAAGLVADERALEVALTAFKLEDEGYSTSFIQSFLEEDREDPSALVNLTSDQRLIDFYNAFNPSEEVSGSQSDVWRFELEEQLTALGAPAEDIEYLQRNWNLIDESLDLVLDPKLLDIVLTAFELPKDNFTNGFVLSMLISDPSDDGSLPNLLGDQRWVEFTKFFGANSGEGNVGEADFQAEVVEQYQQKLYQTQVGSVDQSLRIALNFLEQINEIASSPNVATNGWLEIMADEPLRAVMDGALGLPDEFVQLELEDQQVVYEARSRALFGGSDPSVFLEQENLTRIMDLYLGRSSFSTNSGSPGYLSLISQTVSFGRSLNQTA